VIVDTSAVVAILLAAPQAPALAAALGRAGRASISAGNWVEVEAVSVRRFGGGLSLPAEELLRHFGIGIVPVSAIHAEAARRAYRRFGIGTGHPARLNFGDCLAYALSREADEPLLFVGEAFVHTDVQTLP
jgi:ribonuclease VapC